MKPLKSIEQYLRTISDIYDSPHGPIKLLFAALLIGLLLIFLLKLPTAAV